MNEKLLSLKDEIKSRLGETQDLTDLDKIRVSYLGKKGSITALLKGMKDLPNEERKTFGAEVNKLKAQAAQLIEERLAELKEKEIALMPQFDIHRLLHLQGVLITQSPLFRENAKRFSLQWDLTLRTTPKS